VGRSSAEDGWGWLFALGVPVLPAQKRNKCARLRALCARQNWGDRANSHPQPLLVRLARLSRTKPRGCPGIRFVRRPYAVREKGTLVQWQHAPKAVPERKDQRRRSLHHRDARLTCAQARGKEAPRIVHLCDCAHPEDREKALLAAAMARRKSVRTPRRWAFPPPPGLTAFRERQAKDLAVNCQHCQRRGGKARR
jgi:hypothetical protein